MSVIIILIIASLAVALLFLGAFIWSVRNGQYEDTLTPSMRVLAEDSVQPKSISASETKSPKS
jgi:cbb3-type cytochrome oxidase maturation protein